MPKCEHGLTSKECYVCASPKYAEQAEKQEPVAWTEREKELIDGMIEVQLDHARRCDNIANRTMAEKQKGWDMERVTLLQKIKATPPAAQKEHKHMNGKQSPAPWNTPATSVQEPVAWCLGNPHSADSSNVLLAHEFTPDGESHGMHEWTPLYTHPQPAREWVGLTDEEIIDVLHPLVMADNPDEQTDYEIARAIEAKLKERNS